MGVATFFPQTNLPETPSYNECETLTAKSEGFQDYMGCCQKKGLFFFFPPGYLWWKLINSVQATIYLGEKFLQRLLERSFRGIGLQTTIRQVVSFCPTFQLNNPKRARIFQLAQHIQECGTYKGQDWQMEFMQMCFSQV